MKKLKILSIGATALGMAGTLLSEWVGKKTMNETIKKEVEAAIKAQIKGS